MPSLPGPGRCGLAAGRSGPSFPSVREGENRGPVCCHRSEGKNKRAGHFSRCEWALNINPRLASATVSFFKCRKPRLNDRACELRINFNPTPAPRASLQGGEAGGGSARSVHIPNENGPCVKHKTHLCSLKCAQRAETPAQLSVQKSPFVTTGMPRGPAGFTVFQPKARTFSYSVLCVETERVGRIPSAVTAELEKAKRRRCGESGPHSQRVFLGL